MAAIDTFLGSRIAPQRPLPATPDACDLNLKASHGSGFPHPERRDDLSRRPTDAADSQEQTKQSTATPYAPPFLFLPPPVAFLRLHVPLRLLLHPLIRRRIRIHIHISIPITIRSSLARFGKHRQQLVRIDPQRLRQTQQRAYPHVALLSLLDLSNQRPRQPSLPLAAISLPSLAAS